MSAKFTPGDWYAEQPAMGFSAIRTRDGNKLIFALANPSAAYGDIELSDEEKYANLALLAAAPKMYEALKLAQTFIAEELACREQSMLPASDDDGIYVTAAQNTLKVVEAALRKADGEDQHP